jgi:uncharacterized protein YraI
MKTLFLMLAAGTLFLFPGAANAQSYNANVTTNVYMRTGPSTGYPAVTIVPAGATVRVHGCVAGWTWCDASWGPNRGWIAGAYLQAHYQQRYVPYGYYGPRIGVPIIPFIFRNYWGRHYRGRPWYRNRGRYRNYYRGRRHHRRHR